MIEPEQLAADRLQASSIRYGVWVRVAHLDSGNWAIYHGVEAETGARETGVIEIFESLDPEYLKALSLAEQARAEEQYYRRLEDFEARAAAKPTGPQVAAQSLEDMGL